MSKKASLGLVVVGFNSDNLWHDFFSALDSSSIKPDHVVVVDNSPLPPKHVPSSEFYSVATIHLPHNPGYGSAANAGIKELPTGLSRIVIANADTVVAPNALRHLVDAEKDFPRTGVLGPAVADASGVIYPSARAIPGIRIGIGHALFGTVWPSNPWTQQYLGHYRSAETRPVGWLSGSFLMVNPVAFESIGGFDEGYFMFFEDVDLCFRLKEQGWRSVYVPQASVTHLGGHSTAHNMAEMVNAHHSSARRFLAKLYPAFWQAPLRFALSLGLAVRSAIVSRIYRRESRA
ncbi:glycosyltransferase family 2 protein [Pontimonas sp.]|nr:glycosyltransferase family 2 protein [Pontimonas sp.]